MSANNKANSSDCVLWNKGMRKITGNTNNTPKRPNCLHTYVAYLLVLKGAFLLDFKKWSNCFFPTGISDTVPHRLWLRAGSNTTMITRHHHHHFPTLSLEHLGLSLKLPT
jgi:hypothetical protein